MNYPKVQYIEISETDDGQRVDNYLLRTLKGVPKSHIYRIVRKGEVRVNRGRIKPSYRLRTGDQLRVPPVKVAPAKAPPEVKGVEWLSQQILQEDEAWLVLDKPSGMAVHGGSGLSYGVIEALRELKPELRYLELVHRLDRGTSGCLILAKKRSALRLAHQAMRENRVKKYYLTLTKMGWGSGYNKVDQPLLVSHRQSGERHVTVDPEGKSAVSYFEKLDRVGGIADYVRVRIVTGRTHQIRVHAASVGKPLAGDSRYGDPNFNRRLKTLGLKRLFLHASAMEFDFNGEIPPLDVSSELPSDLRSILDTLESQKS